MTEMASLSDHVPTLIPYAYLHRADVSWTKALGI